MLEFLRRGVKSWVAKVMLGLLVASFAVWGIGDIFSFSLNSPVATVGTRTVTADSFADALQRQQSRASREAQRAVTLTEIRRSGLGDQVLAGLIRDAAVGAELAEIGVSASDEAVARAIRQLDAFRGPDGEFSSTAYRSFLAQQGFNPAQFEALQRDLLGQEMLLSAVAGTGTAPPGVAARLAALEGEERRFDILTLDLEMAPEPATPDSTTLGAFLEENALLFQEPDRKYGRYLHIDIRALAEAHEPTEQDLRAGYDAAADRFVTPAQATIEQLNFSTTEEAAAAMAALDGGKSFDDLLADRELTAADVSLGTVGRDGLPETIAEAVFALDAPGIAGPVATLLGEALLRVTEISAETVTPFEEARATLAQALKDRHAISRAPQLAGDIDDRRAAGETLDEITAALDGVTLG
ncbi:MAG: SurA N-terminal domain-containing protein, partial [Pseudomonadota bacterium]